MRIYNNIASINSINNLSKTDNAMSKTLEKLSSGLRINRAADDAAGLAISEKMRAQINSLEMAKRNTMDGISLVQTAEGALTEIHAILQRMRELTVQAANGTYSDSDKANIQTELNQLLDEVNNIANNTKFNNIALLDGSKSANGVIIQIGVAGTDTIEIKISSAKTDDLGTSGAGTTVTKLSQIAVDSSAKIQESIGVIDAAINDISTLRANLGAYQNRLEHTMNNLATTSENLQAAESRIRDADMAKEMATFTKYQVLIQAGVSMAAQANQRTQAVQKLLG